MHHYYGTGFMGPSMEVNLEILRKWICDIMRETDFGADEFDFVDLCAYGSITNGRADKDSDLDILL